VALGALVVGSVVAVDPGGLAPFGPARFAVVSTSALLALAVALRTGGWLAKGPALAWAGVLAIVAVSAVLGLDPLYAWIGTPERHFGVLTWALCGATFVAGHLLAHQGARVALPAVVASVGLAGLWTAAEVLGFAPLALVGTGERPVATLGSSAYLGAAMVLLVPVTLGLALDPGRSRRLRYVAASAGASGGFALVVSGARAAWVGALVAGVAVVVARRPPLRRVVPWVAGGAVTMVALAAVTGVVARVPDTLGDGGGGIGGRLDEWRVATSVLAAHPLTGVGPEGYRIAFGRHVDDAYEIDHGRDPLPDRAHAAVLDVATTVGLPGLAAYLALLAVVGRFVVRGLRRGPPAVAGIAAGLIGYVAQSAFLFPLAELDPLAWMLAGMVVAAMAVPSAMARLRPVRVAPVALAVACLVVLVAGGLDVAADRRARKSLLSLSARAPAPAAPASQLRPDALRYHLVDARVDEATGTLAGLEAAIDDLDQALDLSPLDPLARGERARLVLELARGSGDAGDLATARQVLERLATDDPRNAEVLLRLGLVRALTGDAAGAEAAWLSAERLAPASAAASTNLAVAYARQGRHDEARAAAERALARDPSSERAAAVLENLGT
jgi:O-antigen ligase/Flp pilus assembly protein TadD